MNYMQILWIIVIILLLCLKVYYKLSSGVCTCGVLLPDKTIIVTGANTGIGYETAKDLARRGARVILACRNPQKGMAARNRIIKTTGNSNISFRHLDLSSFDSIRAFVQEITRTEQGLHVLINNAGTGKLNNAMTNDRLPIEAQINHFGPFLLTMLLLPMMKESAPSRIINVSSMLHKYGKIDKDKFHKQAKSYYEHMKVYCNTKLANILFTKKLSRELEGTGVTVNCLHPGAVSTDMFRDQPFFVRYLISFVFKTPWEGAQTSIHLAASPKVEDSSGKYYADCEEAKCSKDANDYQLAEILWQLSEDKVFKPKQSY